jgi:hypothetical protein
MRFMAAISLLVVCGQLGCGLTYQDQVRSSGLTNFHVLVAPSPGVAGIYRTGIPTSSAQVADLKALVEEPGRPTFRISLHDDAEGSESWVSSLGWGYLSVPLYPEDDKPWTVFLRPVEMDVWMVRDRALEAHAMGMTVVFGCVHDRERGGLLAGLLAMRLFGWGKETTLNYMVATGSRILVTPGLLDFYLSEVSEGVK